MKHTKAHPLTETPQRSDNVADLILEAEQGVFEEVDVDAFLAQLYQMIVEAEAHEATQKRH